MIDKIDFLKSKTVSMSSHDFCRWDERLLSDETLLSSEKLLLVVKLILLVRVISERCASLKTLKRRRFREWRTWDSQEKWLQHLNTRCRSDASDNFRDFIEKTAKLKLFKLCNNKYIQWDEQAIITKSSRSKQTRLNCESLFELITTWRKRMSS